MTTSAEPSIEDMVEQIKKTKSSKSSKPSRSGRSSKGKSRSSRKVSAPSSSESSGGKSSGKKKKSFLSGIFSTLKNNRMVWIGAAVVLGFMIYMYMTKKNKKALKDKADAAEEKKKEEENKVETFTQDQVNEQIRSAFEKQSQMDQERNIMRLKLPPKYLTDHNGNPVVLTPEVLENIKAQAVKVKKKTKKVESEVEDDDDSEDENLRSQDLTNTEMDDIRNELDQMDNNSIMPSNG